MTISKGAFLSIAVAFVVSCGGDQSEPVVDDLAEVEPPELAEPVLSGPPAQPATATLRNSEGHELGEATFVQEGDEVAITVIAQNLEGGERAIHIHSVGQCEGPAFESAGDHFNPTNRSHGLENPAGPHAGDLPNLEIDPDDNMARETLRTDRVTLRPGEPHSLLGGTGTSLVIHAGTDDHTSQPSGNSGDPLYCGVITPA
jgi:Cu-Zn family superoxide dismutase